MAKLIVEGISFYTGPGPKGDISDHGYHNFHNTVKKYAPGFYTKHGMNKVHSAHEVFHHQGQNASGPVHRAKAKELASELEKNVKGTDDEEHVMRLVSVLKSRNPYQS